MEMTISGVSVKLSADEIISALLSDEGKGLWELKRKLDEIESQITEVEFEEPQVSKLTFHPPQKRPHDSILTGSDKIVFTKTPEGIIDGSKKTFFEHDEMGMFPTQIMPEIKDLLQSDTELPPSPKKSLTVKKKRRRRRINPKTGKRYYHRKIKKTKFVEAKNHKPIINDEDSPAIPPAKRPSSRSIELNV